MERRYRYIGMLIGALVLAAGLYYFFSEKNDKESRRIYEIISFAGAAVFAVMCVLLILDII